MPHRGSQGSDLNYALVTICFNTTLCQIVSTLNLRAFEFILTFNPIIISWGDYYYKGCSSHFCDEIGSIPIRF